jgi:hypothetical protein
MNERHASAVLAMTLLACSATPPPAEPPAPPAAEAEADPSPSAAPDEAAASAEPETVAAPGVKRRDDSVPDDYAISQGDCVTLGKRLGELTRSDEAEKVSPKLKEALREKAMRSIDEAASKIESQWASSCEKSLVGKVGDPKALKCALNATNVKAFDVCLNGETAAPKKK